MKPFRSITASVDAVSPAVRLRRMWKPKQGKSSNPLAPDGLRGEKAKEAPSHCRTKPPLLFLNLLFYQHALVGLTDNKNIILIAG